MMEEQHDYIQVAFPNFEGGVRPVRVCEAPNCPIMLTFKQPTKKAVEANLIQMLLFARYMRYLRVVLVWDSENNRYSLRPTEMLANGFFPTWTPHNSRRFTRVLISMLSISD
eukprot:GHVN01022680.1.p1 GENE.GHVN01022680.1~~GHVN01022680.1.p1  ORF type:complete len:112 (+),score=7.72 GHVN01022680.1:462-797(+)